ncbi:right-handed parallel beta-helix repeat-containing protein [Anaeromyxobacter oryzae]|uniref:right-handed parallel beta-helix repeat-containing protein n=1 Tax=Anaeromyxobacter oryzae TaxID=2918170 RepID=UPI0020C06D14|nr:right-handed parallel beta-helix repeat-containing protein [Anaeromyxobacter oryzae]
MAWSVVEPEGGTIDASGAYVAPATEGTYHIVALAANSTQKSASINVKRRVKVAVSPTAATVDENTQLQLAATVSGTGDSTVIWSVQEGATGGTVDATGKYTAPGATGTYHVVATSHADPTKSATSAVSVTAAPAPAPAVAVAVTPATASVLTGATVQLAAAVTGSTDTAVTWSVQEGAAGGIVSASGLYTAPATAGTYHVVATSHADPTKTASSTITVTAPPVTIAVTVKPATASVVAAGTVQLTATVTGSTDTALTWSVLEGTAGGMVSASGLYTAPATAGTYHVVATSHADPSKSATATITVTAASAPIAVTMNPTTASLLTGGTVQLTATVTGSTDTAVTWSVQEGSAGGTVSASGLYTAPATAGTYHVVATSHADASKSATATVTVTASGTTQPGYYASPSGSGTNCTLASPCSLSTGIGKLRGGDTLFLRGGTYNQTVAVGTSGTASSRITIAGYPGETAIIDGGDTLPSGSWGVLVSITGSYVTLRDLEVKRSLWMGIRLSGTYDQVINVYAHDNWENGILVSGNYGLVEGCRVYNNAKSNVNCSLSRGNWASGLSAARTPTGVIMRKNTVWNNWGEGISAFEAYSTTIEDNVSYDNYSVNMYISDAVGTLAQRNLIYATGAMTCGGSQLGIAISSEAQSPNNSDTTLINNMVANTKINFYFYSADTDGMTNTLIANNTFVNSKSGANFKIGDNRVHVNTAIRNNLILQETSPAIADVNGSGLVFSNNLWSKTPVSSAASSTDVIANPQLAKTGSAVNLTGDYFKLLPGSPAIGKAVVLPQVTVDFFGNARTTTPDIGGDEL